jgi:proline iminopeptidase
MPRGDLFPEIGPFETGYLPLTDGHVMYWEQVGNPRGRPVLFLHGGPAPAPYTAAFSTRPIGAS